MQSKKPFIILITLVIGLMLLGLFLNSYLQSEYLGTAIASTLGFLFFAIWIYIRRAGFFAYQANVAFEQKNIDKCLEFYQKAVDVPNCPELIKVVYGYRLLSHGNIEKATTILNSIDEKILDDNARFNYEATNALIIWKNGNIKKAILIYQELLQKRASELIYETLGFLLVCDERYNKAIELSQEGLELFPNSYVIKDNLATAYFYSYEDKKARRLYKELIDDDVSFSEPYYYYGRMAYEDEKLKMALKYLQIALTKEEIYLSHLKHKNIENLLAEVEDALEQSNLEEDVPVVNEDTSLEDTSVIEEDKD